MLAPTESAPNRPSPLPLPSGPVAAELGPAVMADDPCEAAFSAADPPGPTKYYRARYYDPKIGRFISEDPIGLRGGDVNFYAYVRNSPTNFIDPLGLQWVPPRDAQGNPMTSGALPDANFYGAEAHFFGGGGATSVTCTDECGKKRTFRFAKVCLGGAMGADFSAGYVTGMEGLKCRADSYKGYFYEAGASWGYGSGGADFGYNSNGPFGGPGSLSGVNEGSLGFGLGFRLKSTWCYYIPIP
jgi:RHS repeat-associated protein